MAARYYPPAKYFPGQSQAMAITLSLTLHHHLYIYPGGIINSRNNNHLFHILLDLECIALGSRTRLFISGLHLFQETWDIP